MFRKWLLVAASSLLSSSAFAACTNPLSIKDGGGSSISMSMTSNADGFCQYNFNMAQINGVVPLMGAGATGTGSPRVTAASDSPEVAVLGATGDSAATAGSTGSLSAKLRLMTTQLDNINTNIQSGAGAFAATTPSSGVAMGFTNGSGNLTSPSAAAPLPVTAVVTGTAAATQSGTWTVQPGNTPNTSPWLMSPIPATAGGLTVETFQPTASTNSANIKASAGQVYKIDVFNNSATVHYIRLYNSATTGTCNSSTNLIWQGIIPASTSGAGLSSSWDLGIAFSAGIARCVTSGYDGTGNATASAIITNIGYK